ncbi:phasin family protein [Sphingomonas sp. LY54]|uniref:phasin family protein n=1 Tax=Sphingomonas sp. LY54 TaxID=3095343 RepID=UPI002D78B2D3|nr:phasin family protein [Sphingomonas sp. LY54]WRP29833.1 phasin family protein [Sphingomonas sp. LY54]
MAQRKGRPARAAQPQKVQPAAAVKAAADTAVPAEAEAIEASIQQIEEGTSIMTNKTETTIETGKIAAERIQAAFGDVNERAKVAVEKSTKIFEEASELTKGNVEALVASSKVVARGVETLGQEVADYSRRSFEEASTALKSLAEAKSATDFFKLQGDFARAAFDSLMAESSKVSEHMVKLAGEVAEPITSRYSVAAERVKTLAL